MALAVKYSGRGKEAKKEGGETGAKSNINRTVLFYPSYCLLLNPVFLRNLLNHIIQFINFFVMLLHDYINMLDEIKADDVFYQAYYRGVFTKMADRLAEQIEYDYEKQLEKGNGHILTSTFIPPFLPFAISDQ